MPLDSSEVDIREQVANVRSAVQITGSPGPDAPVGSDSGEDSPVQLGAAARRDIYFISAEPGTPRRSDPHMPGVIEHVVLCAAARWSESPKTPSNCIPATTSPTPAMSRTS